MILKTCKNDGGVVNTTSHMGRTTGGKTRTSHTPGDPYGVGGFEGVCLNSRHLGPRRAWKGGSEPRLLTPDPWDPLDPVDPVAPRMNSKWL